MNTFTDKNGVEHFKANPTIEDVMKQYGATSSKGFFTPVIDKEVPAGTEFTENGEIKTKTDTPFEPGTIERKTNIIKSFFNRQTKKG